MVAAAATAPGASPQSLVAAIVAAAPLGTLRNFIAVRTAGSSMHGGVCVQKAAVHTFLRELRSMPLYTAVAAAMPPPEDVPVLSSAADGGSSAGAAMAEQQCGCPPVPTGEQRQQQDVQPPQQQQHDCGPPAGGLQSDAAACSTPALAASGAQPAVMEDLSRERACLLLLMSPREVWREVPDAALREGLLALLDTSMHAGGRMGGGEGCRGCVDGEVVFGCELQRE